MPYRSCRPYGSSLPRCRETRVPDLLACQKGFHRVRKPTLPLQFASGAIPLPDPSTAASSSARTCALGRESSPTSLSSSPAEGMRIRLPTCSTGSSESAAHRSLQRQYEHEKPAESERGVQSDGLQTVTTLGSLAARCLMNARTDGSTPFRLGISAVSVESSAFELGSTRRSVPDRTSSRQT